MIGKTTFTALCLAVYACAYKSTGTIGYTQGYPGTSHTGIGEGHDWKKGPVGVHIPIHEVPVRYTKWDDQEKPGRRKLSARRGSGRVERQIDD